MTVVGVGMMMLTACNGIFDDIYDKPTPIVPAKGQIVMDARSWSDWYYVDLPRLKELTDAGDADALLQAQTEFTAYPIPMEAVGDTIKSEEGHLIAAEAKTPGQYMYWFDVFGLGIQNNRFEWFVPCAVQSEPDEWSFAIHRDNVRTNGGAVLETSYTSMNDLPATSESFKDKEFTEDEWSENEVWDSQEKMLLKYVPSQGICINKVLSSWLTVEIKTVPPTFSHNNHVFILRLKDGTYAALQLENYKSADGKNCWLTINYKYPY